MNIDIEKVKDIKNELMGLYDDEEVLFIEEDGEVKYAIMNIIDFKDLKEIMDLFDGKGTKHVVRFSGLEDIDVSYEDYEKIRKQVIEEFDKTFKPKPEKLN